MTIPSSQNEKKAEKSKVLTILFWNVENLFDDIDDPGWFDDDMVTTGHPELYELKIKKLQEILAPFTEKMAVLCFSEIENKAVLEKLLVGLPNQEHYKIVYQHNNFARIKVAILSPYKVLHSEALDYARGQRPILRADIEWNNSKLTIFVNHWKSRRGGTQQTEKKRLASAHFLHKEVNKIRKRKPDAEILLVGDFNDHPTDRSIKKVLHSSSNIKQTLESDKLLYNCLADKKLRHGKYKGTLSHKGKWELFDQVLVSSGLLDPNQLHIKSCKIYDANEKLIYHGRPNRFGNENVMINHRGYSDHLPIVTEIIKNK